MNSEHQSIVIWVVILLLIINTTALLSLASDKGMFGFGQNATAGANKSSGSSGGNPALVSPTVSSNKTTTSGAANASKTAPAKSPTTAAASPAKSSPAVSTTPRYLSYTNTSYSFSIDYPSNWTKVEMTPALLKATNASRMKSESGLQVVDFFSPAIVRCDNIDSDNCVYVRTQVSVDVEKFPENTTIDDYFNQKTLAMLNDDSVGTRRASPITTLDNAKAYSIEYNAGYDLNRVYVTKVFGLFGGEIYTITYRANFPKSGEVNQFEEYSGDFQHMIKSFNYTGSLIYL
jgi:PsbP-like protein